MSKDAPQKTPSYKDDSLELSALMLAHLDEVEGGGAHASWKRVTAQLSDNS